MNRGLELVKAGAALIKVNSPKRKMVTIEANGRKSVKLFESFEAMDEFVDAKIARLAKAKAKVLSANEALEALSKS